ncbi:MAG: hypothetical protein K6E13_06120 [Lachnospiraceae bacterium]|nr:hypothetical protein [Lachnospiraceae bacterium]
MRFNDVQNTARVNKVANKERSNIIGMSVNGLRNARWMTVYGAIHVFKGEKND